MGWKTIKSKHTQFAENNAGRAHGQVPGWPGLTNAQDDDGNAAINHLLAVELNIIRIASTPKSKTPLLSYPCNLSTTGPGTPGTMFSAVALARNWRLASTSPGCLVCHSCSGRRPTLGPRSRRSPCRSRARRWSSPPWSFSCGESAIKIGPHRFAYRELFYATKGFKDRNLVGAGSFGRALSKASASALPAAARPLTPEPAPHRRRLLCRGHRVSFAWACLRGRRALLLLGGVVVKPAKGKRRGSEPSAWGMSRESATRERAKPASGR